MKIKCTLATIDDAIKALDDYEKKLKDMALKVAERVADIGVAKAQSGFQSAQYDGTNDVIVTKEFDTDAVYVVATGNAVAFIEFGTGSKYPDEHPNATESWMTHGSFSDGEFGKGHWQNEHGWWFSTAESKSQHTYGNPANMCLYYAAREMESKAKDIAREVFGND